MSNANLLWLIQHIFAKCCAHAACVLRACNAIAFAVMHAAYKWSIEHTTILVFRVRIRSKTATPTPSFTPLNTTQPSFSTKLLYIRCGCCYRPIHPSKITGKTQIFITSRNEEQHGEFVIIVSACTVALNCDRFVLFIEGNSIQAARHQQVCAYQCLLFFGNKKKYILKL